MKMHQLLHTCSCSTTLLELPELEGDALGAEPGPPVPVRIVSLSERPLSTSYDVLSVIPRTTGLALYAPSDRSITNAAVGLSAAMAGFWLCRLASIWPAWLIVVFTAC